MQVCEQIKGFHLQEEQGRGRYILVRKHYAMVLKAGKTRGGLMGSLVISSASSTQGQRHQVLLRFLPPVSHISLKAPSDLYIPLMAS